MGKGTSTYGLPWAREISDPKALSAYAEFHVIGLLGGVAWDGERGHEAAVTIVTSETTKTRF